MGRKRYISTKSDYTFKEAHKSVTNGTIYETDHMTISPLESLFNNGEYVLSDSNFRFSTRTGNNLHKKHKRGNWIPNGSNCSADTYVWSTNYVNIDNRTEKKTDIKVKPDYTSLKQFAYFGSAVNLIEGAVNDVVMNFPAEMYFTDEPLYVSKRGAEGLIEYEKYKTYKRVANDYNINISTTRINEADVNNSLRYFCLRYADYEVISGTEKAPVTSWTVTLKNVDICGNGGEIAEVVINGLKLIVYSDLNEGKLLIGYKTNTYKDKRIRPKQNIIDKYFDSLNDFECVLLNRKTNPIYKAKLQTPIETEEGNFYSLKNYIWPSEYGFNPDIESNEFKIYYSNLYNVAVFHDNLDSDNMWRNMTHEAIKNLDWTYLDNEDNDIKIDASRIEPVVKLWGRIYDDLKRYTENIKTCNTVTYDGKNNTPDYFLTDQLNLDGWETKNLFNTYSGNNETDVLFPTDSKGYNYDEANTEFFRRLKLNSHYLKQSKGTRKGVESLLGLMGFSKDTYNITEKVAVAQPKPSYTSGFALTDFDVMEAANELKISYPLTREVEAINKSRDGFYLKHKNDYLGGLSVKSVTLLSGNTDISYVVPWFDNTQKYDGDTYFQMNGGWCKKKDKRINLSIAPSIHEIYSASGSGLQIYDETESYLHFVDNLQGLKEISLKDCKQGSIAYVTDLTDISSAYDFKDNEEKQQMLPLSGDGFSHYFVLVNTAYYFQVGYNTENEVYGWKNLLTKDIERGFGADSATTYYIQRLLYLESIENTTEGNNPHIGRGCYDDGQEYVDRMGQIFHYGLNNEEFTSYNTEDCLAIANYGYTMQKQDDNQKCWFYSDTQFNKHDSAYNTESEDGELLVRLTGKTGYTANGKINENMAAVNPESGLTNDEAAANSIVNLKNMKIDFYYPSGKTEEYITAFKNFIDDNVMFYVKQILPSSSIFSYGIIESGTTWSDEGRDPYIPDMPDEEPIPIPTEIAIPVIEQYEDVSMIDILGMSEYSNGVIFEVDNNSENIIDK